MKKLNVFPEKWHSEEPDWNDSKGAPIAVWLGCIVSETEFPDVISFFKDEAGIDVEPIGSFTASNGVVIFVFTVKSNVAKFSIWRFNFPGMKWWFDLFSAENGGYEAPEVELLPIIEKLGLSYREAI